MSVFAKFNCFVQDVGQKLHNLNSDALKIYLTNTTPVATNTVYNTPADLTTANGYTAGGPTVGTTGYTQTAGVGTLTGTSVVTTAAGGTVGPFRYAVLYNNTAAAKNLIGWWDYGSAITLNDTETFTVTIGASILTIT
jgi:hypothetical protein